MINLPNLFSDPGTWTEPLRFGASVLIRSSLVLALALAVSALLRRRCAATRHLVLALGIAASLVVPLVGLITPAIELAWLPPAAGVPTAGEPSATSQSAPLNAEAAFVAGSLETEPVFPESAQSGLRSELGAPFDWKTSTAFLFLAISAFSILYLSAGVVLVLRLYRRSSAVESDSVWPALLDPLRRRLGVERPVRLRLSEEAQVPLTLGLRHPAVIVPTAANNWSPTERRAVLLHELGHVARWDWPIQLLARFACGIYWFNPLAWFACRQLLVEAERACDDIVLASGESPPTYARQLLDLANRRHAELPVFGAVTMARRADLSRRIQAILDPAQQRATLRRRQTALFIAVTTLLVLVVAPARLVRGGVSAEVGASNPEIAESATEVETDTDEDVPREVPALLQAVQRSDEAEIERLLAGSANPNESTPGAGTPLIAAAARGDAGTVSRLLAAGASPDLAQIVRDRRSTLPRSPLGAAAQGGSSAVVELLLEAGADPGFAPRGDATPLMIAAEHGHEGVVRTLLAAGADFDRTLKGDGTALIAGARGGDTEIVRDLLAAGADPNTVVVGDGSPLIEAVRQGDNEMVAELIDAGANPDRWVDGDESALFHAVASGQTDIVRILVAAGADVNAVWPGDGTALLVATRAGNDKIIELLLEAGARGDQGVAGDGNALIAAAANDDTELLGRMLAEGADPNAAVEGDGSPLIAAARAGNLDAVELLVQSGADVDLVVPGDENPLIQAAGEGHYEVVRYLLDVGADPNARVTVRRYDGDTEVRSPLLLAQREGHQEIVDLLISRGAKP